MISRAAVLFFTVAALGAQSSDEAATAALRKLADRMREARTLSARVVQTRRTELTDKPITSSGLMYYRRDPARLVFHLAEPRKAEIHMDRTSYQVYRPDEKRLERTDFGNEDVSGKILMMFEPKTDELGKTFSIRGGGVKDGLIDVRLESSDEKVRKRLRKIVLQIAEADGALRSLAYTDGEGDEVKFELSDVDINPALAPETFTLKVPEGTRVLRHSLPQDK
ncbi:MAG: outer membrane lipoprotein carrier protein LolA [Planctomycetota bacterium]|nr:MAG: outer membrane lipoprotein carrier protein LolA [Planctomycetota bacterium]